MSGVTGPSPFAESVSPTRLLRHKFGTDGPVRYKWRQANHMEEPRIMSRSEYGLTALASMFERSAAADRPAFMPFYPIGFPTLEDSRNVIRTLAGMGVDAFEIGVPFSDPLADGPTIQAATQVALENGVTPKVVIETIRDLRGEGIDQPIMLFSYLNPLLNYGIEKLITDAVEIGIDGFIIPDLPPDEAEMFAGPCAEAGLALIFFLAPTSDAARIELVGKNARGFIYVVSITGVTGARKELPADLLDFLDKLRVNVSQPLVLGFGISEPEHVASVRGSVEGFIVGSAFVRAAEAGGIEAVKALGAKLKP